MVGQVRSPRRCADLAAFAGKTPPPERVRLEVAPTPLPAPGHGLADSPPLDGLLATPPPPPPPAPAAAAVRSPGSGLTAAAPAPALAAPAKPSAAAPPAPAAAWKTADDPASPAAAAPPGADDEDRFLLALLETVQNCVGAGNALPADASPGPPAPPATAGPAPPAPAPPALVFSPAEADAFGGGGGGGFAPGLATTLTAAGFAAAAGGGGDFMRSVNDRLTDRLFNAGAAETQLRSPEDRQQQRAAALPSQQQQLPQQQLPQQQQGTEQQLALLSSLAATLPNCLPSAVGDGDFAAAAAAALLLLNRGDAAGAAAEAAAAGALGAAGAAPVSLDSNGLGSSLSSSSGGFSSGYSSGFSTGRLSSGRHSSRLSSAEEGAAAAAAAANFFATKHLDEATGSGLWQSYLDGGGAAGGGIYGSGGLAGMGGPSLAVPGFPNFPFASSPRSQLLLSSSSATTSASFPGSAEPPLWGETSSSSSSSSSFAPGGNNPRLNIRLKRHGRSEADGPTFWGMWEDERTRMVYVSWLPRTARATDRSMKKRCELVLKDFVQHVLGFAGLEKVLLFPPTSAHCKMLFATEENARVFLSVFGGTEGGAGPALWKLFVCRFFQVDIRDGIHATRVRVIWADQTKNDGLNEISTSAAVPPALEFTEILKNAQLTAQAPLSLLLQRWTPFLRRQQQKIALAAAVADADFARPPLPGSPVAAAGGYGAPAVHPPFCTVALDCAADDRRGGRSTSPGRRARCCAVAAGQR